MIVLRSQDIRDRQKATGLSHCPETQEPQSHRKLLREASADTINFAATMSSAKACLVLALVTVLLFAAPLHAQLFGLGGGNRAANNIQFMCILGRRLQNRMDCGSGSGGFCNYIKNNIGRCSDSGTAMRALGGALKRFNTGRSRAGRLPMPVPKMNMGGM
ncbi:hypothetical protein RRG08_036892 [Elysia crispata]|uniref:Uncharacterized protein n=1 Tax=Elysia crispata TaxID=231223 RepID=A0AAE0ZBS8_9GAST|nr:hypothetical protein RRG08_036892 [Elysia crispata]